MTPAATALFLILDIFGVAEQIPNQDGTQRSVLWEWWALGAFLIFFALVASRIFELRKQVESLSPDVRLHGDARVTIDFHTKKSDTEYIGTPTLNFPVKNFGQRTAYHLGVYIAYGDHTDPTLLNWIRTDYKYIDLAPDDPFFVNAPLKGVGIRKLATQSSIPGRIEVSKKPLTVFLGIRYATKPDGPWVRTCTRWMSFNPGSQHVNVALNHQVDAFHEEVTRTFEQPIPDTEPDLPEQSQLERPGKCEDYSDC